MLRLGLDLDEVVSLFAEPGIDFVERDTGFRPTAIELYEGQPGGHTESGLSNADFSSSLWRYQLSDEWLKHPALPGLVEAYHRLSRGEDERIELRYVTSRDHRLEGRTHDWMRLHLPDGMIPNEQDITFVGNVHASASVGSKAKACLDYDVDWFIDDHPKYVDEVGGVDGGPRTILFGEYPWNKGHTGEHFIRAASWAEVITVVRSGRS